MSFFPFFSFLKKENSRLSSRFFGDGLEMMRLSAIISIVHMIFEHISSLKLLLFDTSQILRGFKILRIASMFEAFSFSNFKY